METWGQIIASSGVTLILIGAGYLANRRLGIGKGQQILVTTLKDTVDALQERVPQLERDFKACKRRLDAALRQQDDLKQENQRLWDRMRTFDHQP